MAVFLASEVFVATLWIVGEGFGVLSTVVIVLVGDNNSEVLVATLWNVAEGIGVFSTVAIGPVGDNK